MLPFLIGCVAAVSSRNVSWSSLHRFGLEAELSDPERSVRVVIVGFSKFHWGRCVDTIALAMVPGGESKSLENLRQTRAADGFIVLTRRLARRMLRYETLGVQALAPMVTDGAWLW